MGTISHSKTARAVLLALAWPLLLCAAFFGLPGTFPSGTNAAAQVPTAARFAVIGDYGSAGQNELDVSNLIRSWNPDFIITVGDNNYDAGCADTIDANIGQYFHDFIYPYTGSYGPGASSNKFFPALGNHEWDTCGPQPYLDYFTLPNNERYYDYSWGPVHFYALDSDPHEPEGVISTSIQAEWLHDRLLASTEPWKLVYFHHPPYSSGTTHGSTPDLQWPFQQWGASAVLTGHEHNYERLMQNGLPYFVNGLGGRSIFSFGTPIPGSVVRYNGDYGAQLVNADAGSISFQFYNRAGVLIDTYSMTAPTPTLTPTGTPPTSTPTGTITPTRTPSYTPTRTPTVLPGLCWEAESGAITPPFQVAITGTTTYISQTIRTFTPSAGGRAVYRFVIPSAGGYVVSATINGPAVGSSFFINVDGEPTTSNIWDSPNTQGQFVGVPATWRSTAPNPVVFNLAAGEHELIIRGREADLLLDRLCVQPYGPPFTATSTPTVTPTRTATRTRTPTPTATLTQTPTPPPAATLTLTPTTTSTPAPTDTPTATYTPTPTPAAPALLVGHVTWQGPPEQPHARQQQPVTLTLRLNGVETNYPTQITDPGGFFTVTVTGLPGGDYTWRAKGPKYLATSGQVTLAGDPATAAEMGLMLAGDCNNDNLVRVGDFIILKLTFGLSPGQPDYDERADFTADNLVTVSDFILLRNNFGLGGAP